MGGGEPVNILLVDDQPGKLLTYRAILEELGETLITAESGREALEHLLKKDIAVVLIDVIMPDLDGFELAEMIRSHPRYQRTSIIFVSAIALTDLDRLRGYEHGAVDYVPVPVVPELLRAKVNVFAELYRKTRQLERLNAELEKRVDERTAALAQANADLELRVEERTRERESALAQLHEMQKLESLGQLTGGVAHDFNNVLMAVLTNLELISHRIDGVPQIKRYVEAAKHAAERGASLTQWMLAFAKRQELKPEAVDVRLLMSHMTDLVRSSLGPQIELRIEFAKDLDLVAVDPNQLELALLNLAINSRDAIGDSGIVTIGAARDTAIEGAVQGLRAGDYVRLYVADTGIGMDDAALKRAPEPFYTTKPRGKGTGLGLSTVYGLATQSGGAVRISSTLNVGTTVELWLPLADATAVTGRSAPSAMPAHSARDCSILLVDDDALVATAIADMVEQLGHRVTLASSGKAALELVKSVEDLDLVITDHAMPGMTGFELAGLIRKEKPDLPVILATGYADLGGVDDWGLPRIDKPFGMKRLAEVLEHVLK